MLTLNLALAATCAFAYIIFAFIGRSKQVKNVYLIEQPKKRYFWGLSFAILFYLGFPVWWWRYGFLRCVYLLVVCVGGVVLARIALQTLGAEEAGQSLGVGLLLSIPVRVTAGLWVAHRDEAWRRAIVYKRMQKS